MREKKDQHTVGTPQKPRGQQTGFAGNSDQNREEMKETPALRCKRKANNKMFGNAQQHVGSDATKPSTNSPSTPAMNVKPKRSGGGATGFKRRLAKKRATTS